MFMTSETAIIRLPNHALYEHCASSLYRVRRSNLSVNALGSVAKR